MTAHGFQPRPPPRPADLPPSSSSTGLVLTNSVGATGPAAQSPAGLAAGDVTRSTVGGEESQRENAALAARRRKPLGQQIHAAAKRGDIGEVSV